MNENQLLSYVRLKFNIETPMVEEVWLDGYDYAQHLFEDAKNPYERTSLEHHYWNEGWWAGYFGEEPLFTLEGPYTVAAPYYQVQPSALLASQSPMYDFFLSLVNSNPKLIPFL